MITSKYVRLITYRYTPQVWILECVGFTMSCSWPQPSQRRQTEPLWCRLIHSYNSHCGVGWEKVVKPSLCATAMEQAFKMSTKA